MHTYPDLSIEEVSQCLSELGHPLNHERLQKPSAAAVQSVFYHFLAIFQGVKKEQFDIISPQIDELLIHPQLHHDSLALISFYKFVQEFMTKIGINSFQLRDLTDPRPKRLLHFLSGIINFAKFREEQLEMFEKQHQSLESATQERDIMKAKKDDLFQLVNELKTQREQEKPHIQERMNQVSALTESLREFKLKHNSITTAMEQMQQQKNTKEQQYAHLEDQHQKLEAEITYLKSQIVSDPSSQLEQITDLESSIAKPIYGVRRL